MVKSEALNEEVLAEFIVEFRHEILLLGGGPIYGVSEDLRNKYNEIHERGLVDVFKEIYFILYHQNVDIRYVREILYVERVLNLLEIRRLRNLLYGDSPESVGDKTFT
jgi:hypothetical protein